MNIQLYQLIIAGSVTAILVQLKEYPRKFMAFVIGRCIFKASIYKHDQFYGMMETWLAAKYPDSYRNVEINSGPVHSTDEVSSLWFSHEKNDIFMRYNGKLLSISKERDKLEGARNQGDKQPMYFDYYQIKGVFAKAAVSSLLAEILEYNMNLRKREEVKIFSNTGWQWEQINMLKVKDINDIIINVDTKTEIVNDITTFINSEKWYDERHIPYKRNYLIHGDPGNGKTSISMAIAKMLKRDLYYLNVDNVTSDIGMYELLQRLKPNSLLLIEDIDKIFGKDREAETKISFSTFINCMDGVLYKRGMISISTTNHIDKIDDALLREGRMDKKILVNNPDDKLISDYVSGFYKCHAEISGVFGNVPMSKIQEICIQNRDDVDVAIKTISKLGKVVHSTIIKKTSSHDTGEMGPEEILTKYLDKWNKLNVDRVTDGLENNIKLIQNGVKAIIACFPELEAMINLAPVYYIDGSKTAIKIYDKIKS